MKEIHASVGKRGTVTIPTEVRRLLGLTHGGTVVFRVEESEVRLAPALFTLESAYGSVQPLSRPEDFDQLTRTAWGDRVRRVAEQMESE